MGEPLNHVARALWPPSLADAASSDGPAAADVSALDELARRLQASQMDALHAAGPQYLLFECGGVNCTLPLAQLREVLSDIPRMIPLPNSPEWLLGIFPNRTEMLALVDPTPVLLGRTSVTNTSADPPTPLSERPRTSVLVVGAGEDSLGIVVDLYGDTATIQDHELDSTPDGIAAARLPILPRYIAAIYRPADVDRCYVALNAEHLLSDLISAVQEADEAYG